MQKFSLHTHVSALDGQSFVFEMSLHANRIGYTCLGISDHFIVHPLIKESQMSRFAMNPKNPNVNPYHQIYYSSFEEAVAKIQPVYDEIDKLQEKSHQKWIF